jgi:hypothetical protein
VYASVDDGKTFDKKLKIDTSGGYATISTNNANDIVVFYDYVRCFAAPPPPSP